MQNNDLSNAELHLWEIVQNNPQKIAKNVNCKIEPVRSCFNSYYC